MTDDREETTEWLGMQQWHKEPRPEKAITSGKQNAQTEELDVAKQMVGTSIRLRKMNAGTLWRAQLPLKQKKTLHTVKLEL
jgi:redox-sensitive bicupin YhaK (pirin superfamily)